jgi:hypothetical protein
MKNKSLPDLIREIEEQGVIDALSRIGIIRSSIRTGFIKTSSETTEESSVTGHMKDGKKPVKAVP